MCRPLSSWNTAWLALATGAMIASASIGAQVEDGGDLKATVSDDCYGLNRNFKYVAETSSPESFQKYHFAWAFGFLIPNGLGANVAYARLAFSPSRDKLWTVFHSENGSVVFQSDISNARILECNRDRTVVFFEKSLAAEASRSRRRYTIVLTNAGGLARIETQLNVTSSWLIFSNTEHLPVRWGEFRQFNSN